MGSAKRRVWIIDDEELLSEICAETLKERFEAECFSSARAALLAVDAGRLPDVFISDLKMPEMGGIEFLSELKKRGLQKPFLIVSGFADKDSALQALSLGVFALIEKPFHPVQMIHSVTRAAAYGELLEMTENLISDYKGVFESMNRLVKLCRDRYISAENQLSCPVPKDDREQVQRYLSAILAESRLEETVERAACEIQTAFDRRERLRATMNESAGKKP